VKKCRVSGVVSTAGNGCNETEKIYGEGKTGELGAKGGRERLGRQHIPVVWWKKKRPGRGGGNESTTCRRTKMPRREQVGGGGTGGFCTARHLQLSGAAARKGGYETVQSGGKAST